MATLVRRPMGGIGRFRLAPVDAWRDSSFCMPALILAAAASETDELLGDEELGVRWSPSALLLLPYDRFWEVDGG